MHDAFAYHLLWIGGAMLISVIFGAVALRIRQPRVLGALVGGLIIGVVATNTHLLTELRSTHGIPLIGGLAELAAMLLLFKAGLEGNLGSIIEDARSGWKVAIVGVVLPILGGFSYVYYVEGVAWTVALFQGGVFAATSVGITAAVLGELGVLKQTYARTIISAAVIDDVLGLCSLTVCTMLNSPESLSTSALFTELAGAIVFLILVPVIGQRFAPALLKRLSRLDTNAREAIVLSFMILYGAAALSVGLAAIVGAYFAGVALEEIYFVKRNGEENDDHPVEHFIDNLITAFGPIFFVYAGCIINPAVFLEPSVLVNGIVFTAIAMIGKLACGLVVDRDRLIIGVGMAPRGEVGIIFATLGLQQNILTPELFGASMIMVLVTTMLAPPLLNALIIREPTPA